MTWTRCGNPWNLKVGFGAGWEQKSWASEIGRLWLAATIISRWKISSPFLFHCLKDHRPTSLVPDAKTWENSSFRSCKLTSSASIRTMSIRYRKRLFWTSFATLEVTLHIHSTVWSEIYYLLLQWTLEGKRRGYQFGAILMSAVLFWMDSGGINAAIHLSNFSGLSTSFSWFRFSAVGSSYCDNDQWRGALTH